MKLPSNIDGLRKAIPQQLGGIGQKRTYRNTKTMADITENLPMPTFGQDNKTPKPQNPKTPIG